LKKLVKLVKLIEISTSSFEYCIKKKWNFLSRKFLFTSPRSCLFPRISSRPKLHIQDTPALLTWCYFFCITLPLPAILKFNATPHLSLLDWQVCSLSLVSKLKTGRLVWASLFLFYFVPLALLFFCQLT
jgi:hypothetical protein